MDRIKRIKGTFPLHVKKKLMKLLVVNLSRQPLIRPMRIGWIDRIRCHRFLDYNTDLKVLWTINCHLSTGAFPIALLPCVLCQLICQPFHGNHAKASCCWPFLVCDLTPHHAITAIITSASRTDGRLLDLPVAFIPVINLIMDEIWKSNVLPLFLFMISLCRVLKIFVWPYHTSYL